MNAGASARYGESEHQGILAQIYAVYASNLRLWLFIALPALVVAASVRAATNPLVQELNRRLWSRGFSGLFDNRLLLEIGMLRWSVEFFCWTASVFSFAAIAAAVAAIERGERLNAQLAYGEARARFGRLMKVGTILGLMGVATILISSAASIPFNRSGSWISNLLYWVPLVLGFLLVYSYAMAIPASVVDGLGVRQSLRQSGRAFNQYPGVSMLLFAKSFFGGYLAFRIPYWFILPFLPNEICSGWFVWIVAGLLVTLTEVMVMIGYTEIYIRYSNSQRAEASAS